jgi:hypothetical protein
MNVYVDLVAGLYESIVIHLLFLILMACFEKRAAFMLRIDVTVQHRDKCTINETYKTKKCEYLFSLFFPKDHGVLVLLLIRCAIIQYIVIRLLTTIIILSYRPSIYISTLNHVSLVLAVIALFGFFAVTRRVLWLYDGSMKCLLVGGTAILLFYQSLAVKPPAQSIAVCIEMFFITLYNMWIFPYDEESETSLIYDVLEIT